MAELRLDGTHAIRVVATDGGHRAEPVTDVDGQWRRAIAGDGAGLALLHRLRNRSAVEDGFRVTGFGWPALAASACACSKRGLIPRSVTCR